MSLGVIDIATGVPDMTFRVIFMNSQVKFACQLANEVTELVIDIAV